MNESAGSAQTSRFGRMSHFLGVLSLLLLLICGFIVFQAIRRRTPTLLERILTGSPRLARVFYRGGKSARPGGITAFCPVGHAVGRSGLLQTDFINEGWP
jgi:hypothetical protein